MKKLLVWLACSMLSLEAMCQKDSEPADNFNEVRMDDFKKLIGGIQEGVRINYNTEKANIEGSVATHIKMDNEATADPKDKIPSPFLLQFTGSVGTTTNLSKLFGADLLPTYSGSLTLHYRIGRMGASKYFYDGQFNNTTPPNPAPTGWRSISDQLNDPDVELEDISKQAQNKFSYKQEARDKAISGKITPVKRKLYSFKRISWVSLSAKHDYTKYAFFEPSAAFSSQLIKPQYRTYSLKGSANLFVTWNKEDVRWNRYRPDFFYLTVGLSRGLGNNVSGLEKKTINTVTSQIVDPATGAIRQQVDSKTAYEGVYRQYGTTTPSVEMIFAPFKLVALFANAEVAMIDQKKREDFSLSNSTTLATGAYFYGNGNSTINIGVFYKWVQDSRTQDWIGSLNLRTSIPISPL